MAGDYKQMLIDKSTHDDIASAKRFLAAAGGRHVNSREAIGEFLGKRMRFLGLRKEIRSYINAFVSEATLDRRVLGVMLFGSVARGSFRSDSDIDMLVVVDGKAMDIFEEIESMIGRAEPFRKELVSADLHLRIRPLILSRDELGSFRPIYLNILEDGIALFDRNDTLFNFMNDIRRSVVYRKSIVRDSVVVKWKIRG